MLAREMARPESYAPPMSFSGFPEDVQLTILSFLRPPEIAAFACTSRHSAFLCGQARLWFAMCDRRWGAKTVVQSWAPGRSAGPPFSRLYRVLSQWENLIGFWRRLGRGGAGAPSLVFFEWGASSITGSVVSPSPEAGSYGVLKVPFLWLSLSPRGEPVGFLHPARRFDSNGYLEQLVSGSGNLDLDLIPVTIAFMGEDRFVVEEDKSFYADVRGGGGDLGSSDAPKSAGETSPAERHMLEMYQYFANGLIPIGDEPFIRKQRWKWERDGFGRKRWQAEQFMRIADCYPTPSRPLQGLWKGIGENMRLAFYLVTYDNMGGVACRRVGDASEPFSSYSPVFWTSSTEFLRRPFSIEEENIYDSREHIGPITSHGTGIERAVCRVLCINSSYDLVIPDSSGSYTNSQNVEGRIWVYDTGTFGFGFLRNDYIVDLQNIVRNGCLLDNVDFDSSF
ncbi:hypothetical protein Taro_038196 [Colocasia esculenta]|uniref:F-box protein n=1 Tax=Colocasia esculenta TaxID=4460 RepID=A0A843WC32_COLES|nr:hypothetical protein [Colocasia esculenta]